MKWFYNLKIKLKLILGFITVALIAGIIGAIGIINIGKIDAKDIEMYKLNTVPIQEISNLAIAYQENRAYLRDIVLTSDDEQKNEYVKQIEANDQIIDENLTLYEKTLSTAAGLAEVKKFKNLEAEYRPLRGEAIKYALAEQDAEALKVMQGAVKKVVAEIEESINTLINLKVNLAKEKSVSNTATAQQAILIMIIFVGGGMVLAVGLGVFIANIISKPIIKLVGAADRIAIGDANMNVSADTQDEIGMLMQSFGKMIENIKEQALTVEKIADGDLTVDVRVKSESDLLGLKLKEMVWKNNEILGSINTSSEQVSAGSKQVSLSSQALSQSSTEQAASLEEITSSVTEIAAQTKQNAVNANQASDLSMVAKDSAIEGNQQMNGMLKAMEEINESSTNISKIIKVIEEIAFQTNILALNAAVEAARAGQHGKGFAVVAEEVRNLAARSANAAKETTALIEGSIKKVEAGTKITNQTAEALAKIVENVSAATNLVAEIAAASSEQASGITQINLGVEQVSQATQSNTATAEESASASEELSSQAEMLKEMVSQFKLCKNDQRLRLNGISPDVMKTLEDLVANNAKTPVQQPTALPRSSAQSKIKIQLDDSDYGKY